MPEQEMSDMRMRARELVLVRGLSKEDAAKRMGPEFFTCVYYCNGIIWASWIEKDRQYCARVFA